LVGCGEVLELLREREAACRAEAERLRAEGSRIAVLLAEREEELAELVTTCRVVGQLPMVSVPGLPGPSPGARVPEPRSGERLSAQEISERIPAVLAGYGGPVRVRAVLDALGLEPRANQIERVRHQLRKAVMEGTAIGTPGGLFTLARDVVVTRG
jgi:hypothetical protein